MLIVKKISSVLLAFLVLFSTFSFTIEKHYCGDFLVDVSYFGEADGCGIKMDKQLKKKGCCKDQVEQIYGQQELQKEVSTNLNFEQQKFIVAHIFSYASLFTETKLNNKFYKDFSPPDIDKDIRVLYSTFLI